MSKKTFPFLPDTMISVMLSNHAMTNCMAMSVFE